MAKKGKALEQLVKAIQLSIKDNPNAIVHTNVKIKDTNGCKREIDVLIESPNQNIAIECKEHKRTLGIKVVDEVIGKFMDLPKIQNKAIVSIKGFTKDARIKAEKHNIHLWTLQDAPIEPLLTNGSAYIGHPTYTPQNVDFGFKNINEGTVRFVPIAYYLDSDKEYKTYLTDITQNIDKNLTLSQKKELVEKYFKNGKKPFCYAYRFTPSRELYFVDTEGRKLIVDYIRCSFLIDFCLEQGSVSKVRNWHQEGVGIIEYNYTSALTKTIVVQHNNTNICFRMDNDITTPFEIQGIQETIE